MLGQFGPITFEIQPVNFDETSRETTAGFVEKPVMGRRQPLEFVGDEGEAFKINVKLFPFHFGGMNELGMLDTVRKTGVAQILIRGDGEILGWYNLTSLTERQTNIGAGGVGRKIEVEMSLKRCDPPNAASYFASIAGLF